MSVLVIWASPNENGLTAACKDAAAKGIADAGKEAEIVWLNECSIKRCRVCKNGYGQCKEEGTCVIRDDLAEVYDLMKEAESVVFVTPVYWHDLSEPLKTFLDRVRRMETVHNHALKGKPGIAVAAAGGSGRGTSFCLLNLEEITSHMGMVLYDRLPVNRFSREYMLDAVRASAKRLCDGSYQG